MNEFWRGLAVIKLLANKAKEESRENDVLFYCPYIPLQSYGVVEPIEPIKFKTRYKQE